MKNIYIILNLLILIVSGYAQDANTKLADLLKAEQISSFNQTIPAPDFTLLNLEGESVTLSDYKGKAVLLNFWASWCGPCKAEMPSIEGLYNKTKDMDIVILAVNSGESLSTVESFIKKNNYNFPILIDSKNTLSSDYGVRSIPLTYLINKNGELVGGKVGSRDWDSENIIEILTLISK